MKTSPLSPAWEQAAAVAEDYREIADRWWDVLEERYRETGSIVTTDGMHPTERVRQELETTDMSPLLIEDMYRLVEIVATAIEMGIPRSGLVIDVAIHETLGQPRARTSLYPRTVAA